MKLLEAAMALPGVHIHGPEHHALVPCVLLTAYKNCGGSLELPGSLTEAVKRGGKVPGGSCGYLGACGAAVGAGIFLSILLGSHPLNAEAWPKPQRLTAACLEKIAAAGGPRCCKRSARLAVETAAGFVRELTGLPMACASVSCIYTAKNRECIGGACPFAPGS